MNDCFDQKAVIARLNRVAGQLNGIKKMIEDESSRCEDVMVQINAADSALHRIGMVILKGHLSHCVRKGIEEGRAEEAIENFNESLEQFAGIR